MEENLILEGLLSMVTERTAGEAGNASQPGGND